MKTLIGIALLSWKLFIKPTKRALEESALCETWRDQRQLLQKLLNLRSELVGKCMHYPIFFLKT